MNKKVATFQRGVGGPQLGAADAGAPQQAAAGANAPQLDAGGTRAPQLDAGGTRALPSTEAGDHAALCREVAPYLDASAWQRAFDLLWPHFADSWPPHPATSAPAATIAAPAATTEAVALLLSAAVRIGRHDLLHGGAAYLRDQAETLTEEPRLRSLVLLIIAHASMHAGKAREAQQKLEQVEALADGDASVRVRAALLRGRLEVMAGRGAKAEQWGLRAVDRAKTMGSDSYRGDGYALLAILARQRGALGEANALYASAEQAYWRAGVLSGQLTVRLNRAWCLGLLGLHADARRLFREVIEGAHREDRAHTGVRAELGLGWLSVRAGRLAEARRHLVRVWLSARRLQLHRERLLALEYLVETHVLMGRPDRAETALSLARRAAARLPRGGDVDCELELKTALLALGRDQVEEALRAARRAVRHGRRHDLTWECAQGWRLIGTAYVRRRQRREARRAFERAQRLYGQMGERIESACTKAWLTCLEKDAGDRSHSTARGWDGEDVSGPLRFWLAHPLLGPTGEGATRERNPRVREQIAGTGPTPAAVFPHPDDTCEPPPEVALQPVWSELGIRTRTPEVITSLRLAETYARGRLPALILGETGSGKDLIAQGLHALSGCTGALVPVNCAAAQRELFLAELFGARRGAYTGATEARTGLVEVARNGTLFLDEVADLDAHAQGYLLRFLDSGEVRPLGCEHSHRVETRVIAATCRDLHGMQEEGRFRRDLYARLAALVVELPPLRRRQLDLQLLAEMCWCRAGGDRAGLAAVFSRATLANLSKRAWPGNVRELRQLVERAHLFYDQHGVAAAVDHIESQAAGPEVPSGAGILPFATPEGTTSSSTPEGTASSSTSGGIASSSSARPQGEALLPALLPGAYGSTRPRWPRERLVSALTQAGGSVAGAARILGISRSHAYRLYRRLREP